MATLTCEEIRPFTGAVSEKNAILYVTLSPDDVSEIDRLIDELLGGRESIDLAGLLGIAQVYGHELPRRVRKLFCDFKISETAVGLCVQGYPIDQAAVGPTPTGLPDRAAPQRATRPDILHILFASLLGEPFGWSAQQHGRVLNEILPTKEREDTLSGSGSSRFFDLHTEDAFHPCFADYLGLMCLRNFDRVPTAVSSVAFVDLDESIKATLFEPRFYVRPNVAQAIAHTDERIPLLFGHPDSPYLRVNLNLQQAVPGDEEAAHALRVLSDLLSRHTFDVILQPGDCLYLDNFRAAHGRYAYRPRYDGTDRWLKRLNITSYLRKSRHVRSSAGSRIVMTEPAG